MKVSKAYMSSPTFGPQIKLKYNPVTGYQGIHIMNEGMAIFMDIAMQMQYIFAVAN